jgi:hypothetical protein
MAKVHRRSTVLLVTSLSLAGGLACSTSKTQEDADAAPPSFSDVLSAPAAIQTAARAVVRVESAGELASGSFISASGLLLTNNHVLGEPVCPREGCWIEITPMHQRGTPYQQPETVFAVPMSVDVGLDLAFVQLYTSQGGPRLVTPDFLTLRLETPASLVGTHVTVIGHPEGNLKKWTDGVVAYWTGDWFVSTAYILPGDSGSPAVDDNGLMVGIVHRAPIGEDLITSDGVNVYSIGTASSSIQAAMGAALPAVMISAAAATTAADAVANDRVYLNGRASSVTVAGTSVGVLTLLGQACDAALARQDFVSPEDLSAALAPCDDATLWIECRLDAGPPPYGVECPAADAAAWAARYQAMNGLWRGMNGTLDLYPVSFGIAQLQSSMGAGYMAGAQSLTQALTQAQPELDFTLANYLAAFQVPSYAGVNVAAFVAGYPAVPHYELEGRRIASAAGWLAYHGAMSKNEMLAILSQLHSDPRVDVGSKLYIEELEYAYGAY